HQKSGLAHTWFAPDQDQAARNDAAAEHPVQLVPCQRPARGCFTRDLAQRNRFRRPVGTRLGCRLTRGGLADRELLEGVPGLAVRALAGPAKALAATVGAYEGDRGFGHSGDYSPTHPRHLQVTT